MAAKKPARERKIMAQVLQDNWILVVLGVIVLALLAWWQLASTRRSHVEIARSVEDGSPPRRNQALIDAPPATADVDLPPPTPAGLAGVGEAVQAAAEPVPAAPSPTSAPSPAPVAGSEDLTRIKGLGPKLAEQLRALGVTSLEQIAAWDDAEIDRIDAQLGRFQGRIRRDDWRTQAQFLAANDKAGYEAKFGKL